MRRLIEKKREIGRSKYLLFGFMMATFVCVEAQDIKQIIQQCTDSINSKSTNIGFYYQTRGSAFMVKENYENAIEDLTESINILKDAESYYLRGRSFYEVGNMEKALVDLNKSISLAPDSILYYSVRGLVFESLNKEEKAIEDYSKVITSGKYLCSTLVNRALLLEKIGDLEESLKDWNRVIQLCPNDARHNDRGLLLLKMEKYDEAIKSFSKAIKINPSVSYYIMRGYSKGLSGNLQHALIDFEIAESIDSSNMYLFAYRGEILMINSNFEKACENYEIARELGYDSMPSRCQ